LRFELWFRPGRSADDYRSLLGHIVAWRPALAPREVERSTDEDAPDRPEPWVEARWREVAELAAGVRWRAWTLYSADAAIVVARKAAATKISVVMPRPAEDPFVLLCELIGRLGDAEVPALAMAIDPESKADGGLILQGLEQLADAPPVFYLDREATAAVGGAGTLAPAAAEVRELGSGVAVNLRPVFGKLTTDARSRTKTMRAALGLPRSFTATAAAETASPGAGAIELVQFWPTGADGRFRGVWGAAPELAWAVGDHGMTARWDGDDWSLIEVDAPAGLAAVTGWDDLAWAVGEDGQIVGWDGERWSAADSPTDQLLGGVHASARDRVVAVGERGTIVQWDGRRWATIPSGTTKGLAAVAGTGDELWAVGESGTALRCVDGRWSSHAAPTTSDLLAVSVAAGEVWAAGTHGCVMRFAAGEWTQVATGWDTHLHGILVRGKDDVWVVGDELAIHRWNGTTWSAVPSDTREDLFAISAADETGAWIVGDKALILRAQRG
jgi:hypothetical protein